MCVQEWLKEMDSCGKQGLGYEKGGSSVSKYARAQQEFCGMSKWSGEVMKSAV